MELVVAVAALAMLAVLSVRYGVDSRLATMLPGHPREERVTDVFDPSPPPVPIRSRSAAEAFPTLAMIDRARGDGSRPLTVAPNAAQLEARARELIALYWSDTAWLTGIVPHAAFERVRTELERAVADPVPEQACA